MRMKLGPVEEAIKDFLILNFSGNRFCLML